MLFLHLLVFCFIFAVCYWLVGMITSILPPPTQAIARVILLVLLALIAMSVLLGEIGMWGTWGWGYHYERHR